MGLASAEDEEERFFFFFLSFSGVSLPLDLVDEVFGEEDFFEEDLFFDCYSEEIPSPLAELETTPLQLGSMLNIYMVQIASSVASFVEDSLLMVLGH